MGKKSKSSSSSPALAPQIIMPEMPAPVIIEYEMPEMPEMPVIPTPPTPEYIEPKDYREEELQAANKLKIEKANKLRKGRRATIKTSPLGIEEDADIKKQQLLGV